MKTSQEPQEPFKGLGPAIKREPQPGPLDEHLKRRLERDQRDAYVTGDSGFTTGVDGKLRTVTHNTKASDAEAERAARRKFEETEQGDAGVPAAVRVIATRPGDEDVAAVLTDMMNKHPLFKGEYVKWDMTGPSLNPVDTTVRDGPTSFMLRTGHWLSWPQDPAEPPLGLRSNADWRAARMTDIDAAVKRYEAAGLPVPDEWKAEWVFHFMNHSGEKLADLFNAGVKASQALDAAFAHARQPPDTVVARQQEQDRSSVEREAMLWRWVGEDTDQEARHARDKP